MGKKRKEHVPPRVLGKDDLRRTLPKKCTPSPKRKVSFTKRTNQSRHRWISSHSGNGSITPNLERKVTVLSSHGYSASPINENSSGKRVGLNTTLRPTEIYSTSSSQNRSSEGGQNLAQSSGHKRCCDVGRHELYHPKRFKDTNGNYMNSNGQSYSSSTPFHEIPPLIQQQTFSHRDSTVSERFSESPMQLEERPDKVSPAKPMSYTCAKKLLEEGDPVDTATNLTKDSMLRRFEALLSTGEEIRYDLMKLVISIIEKVGRSCVETHSNRVLAVMQKCNFWGRLSKFVVELYSTKEATEDPDISSLISNLCRISSLCLDRLPDLHSSVPVSQLRDTVGHMREDGKLDTSSIDPLLKELDTKQIRVMRAKRDKATSKLQPPNDFRKLSVFPTRQDIFEGKPFLRENLVDTPFSNVDHYLDIQFRLLKEDSIANLRNGIMELRKQDREKEFLGESSREPSSVSWKNDIKVFHNVKINELVTSSNSANGIVHNVSFDSSHPSIKRTNWERSHRLLYGSLVCLLSDDFETIYFATVQNRDPKMLKHGYVQLCFEGEIPSPELSSRKSFRMVENSSAYFVAYRHILKQLQEMKGETMPFKDYIVACKRDIQQPAYLKEKDADGNPKIIDLSSIADRHQREPDLEKLKRVDPGDLSTWPAANIIGLNDSQYEAFQSALLKEFAVIQGPPGTGKTYLGLKVAHALLANAKLWKDGGVESSPILMLAYTNHALDQFLEGLRIYKNYIIRVGGRSSSVALKDCNLNSVRRQWRGRRGTRPRTSYTTNNRLHEVEWQLRVCESRLQEYTSMYAQSFQGILPISVMRRYTTEFYQNELRDRMLSFLCIQLKPETKEEDKIATHEEYGIDSRDREGYFSTRQFISQEEKDEGESKFYKKIICNANETTKPGEVRRNLEQIQQGENYALRLQNRVTRRNQLWHLKKNDRWCLYQLWLTGLRHDLNRNIQTEQAKHLDLEAEQVELRNLEDLSILRSARVVGMTTTCASKNHKLLRQLQPRIVMVEEAAEVFEGHIVSCLTEFCQHLILIGDHQQLRPNPSVYNLSKKYNLDVSLLERMVKVGVPFSRLEVQHRMRPEISQMVRHIYGKLEDHTSVTEYENVKGTAKNLFFIDHSFPEGIHDNAHSKINHHEAAFLVAFCYYLLQQGYDSSEITILTTYTGQMFTIRDQMRSDQRVWFGNRPPRVSTVDNFQGEENDIILLSLVRNNKEEKIGFLKQENRVCVALSRARKGLYIIGNRTILEKQNRLWKAVIDDLDKNGCIGKYLPLVCAIHRRENSVSCREDFLEKVPNGGCLEPCNHRLECGHACTQVCHPDTDHESFQCKKPCQRNILGCDIPEHKCTKSCCDPCDSRCPHLVEKRLKCGHLQTVTCSKDKNFVNCVQQCEKILPCEHRCQRHCGEPCTVKCSMLVKKKDWPCGHECTIACSSTPKDCPVPCDATLECGHRCPGKCGQCIQGRVHIKCQKKCERILICSHLCKSSCTKKCPPCKNEKCIRRCNHSQCKRSCGEICIPCKEPCEWKCKHFKCGKLCSEICDRPRCDEPCNRKLNCARGEKAHYCRGLCDERCVCVFCHTNNEEDITTIFFGTEDEKDARFIRLRDCEHIFEYTAMDRFMDHDESSNEIKPKVCPRCKVPIEKTSRYGNIVKKIHQNIDRVKRKVLGDTKELDDKKQMVRNLIVEITPMLSRFSKSRAEDLEKAKESITQSSAVYYQDVSLAESQVRLIKKLLTVMKSYQDALKNDENSAESLEFDDEMHNLINRLVVPFSKMNTRILGDLNLELERMSLKRDILVLTVKVDSKWILLEKQEKETIEDIKKKLREPAKMEEEVIHQFKRQVAAIYRHYPQLTPITQEEKVLIVKAIGLKQGHWFKCPKGHVYAIGECGGAMEEARCPDCGADIGGQQHRLAEGNELAREMDGAQYPAWSEQANLRNYEIRDEI